MENEENELVVQDEQNEELEQTNETENAGTQTAEENVENVEENSQTKEELKQFTQTELDKMFKERAERAEKRAIERTRREYEEKYSELDSILNIALKTNSTEEATKKLKEFYKENGIEIPEQTKYSKRDLELLTKAEADSIIESGYEEIVEEVDRLANKGLDNMNEREKLLFRNLATERKRQETIRDLESIGVTKDKLEDSDYKQFSSKLNPELSEKEKYELYLKLKPKKEPESIGSMKSNTANKNEVKDFYTFEEASKFTRKDFDKNPKLFAAVEKSMPLWSKK